MSTTKWALDSTHSEIQFKVRHLMEFIRQVQAETRKVVWPTRRETIMDDSNFASVIAGLVTQFP